MALDDLRAVLDGPKLTLPIGGKEYVVHECSAKVWLKLAANREAAEAVRDAQAKVAEMQSKDEGAVAEADLAKVQKQLADALDKFEPIKDMDMFAMVLGADLRDQMINDDVTPTELRHAGITANLWQLGDGEIANVYWQSGGKALPPPAESEGQPPTATPTRTGAATTTRKRASRSTTTTRPTSKPSEPA